jgi:hypothetical protein
MKTSHSPKPTYDPQGSWLYISVFGVMVLGMVAMVISPYFREIDERKRANWPQTKGTPKRTRVVTQAATRQFPITVYVGQCSVEYIVADRQYSLWASSGYVDKDLKWIADRMQECPVSQYVVRYNPVNPSDASAERLDGPP